MKKIVQKYALIVLLMSLYSLPINSAISHNRTAQALFKEGMLDYYGYLYVQSEYNFRQALLYDPQCAMCYWGLALAKKQEHIELGQSFVTVGYEEIEKASHLVSPNEAFQYDVIQAAKRSFSLNRHSSMKQLQSNYITALRTVYQKYKDNAQWREESLALFVDAIAYYGSINDDGAMHHHDHTLPNEYKQEALDLLTPILKDKSYPDHPGLLHTYIHMAEHNLNDPLGLIAAKKLPAFSHGVIAHYTHMPTHIYWRRGMYDEAIQANLNALAIDEHYFKQGGAGLNSYYYDYHYLHSHYFLVALGILTNQYDLAITHARAIKNLMDVSRMEYNLDYRDTFLSLESIVLARFNKWSDVLNLHTPSESNELARLLIHFTRDLAYLNLEKMSQFKSLYEQIKNTKYTRSNIIELQTLVISYLKGAEMNVQHAALIDIEQMFLKNKVDRIEEKLFLTNNPPLWFFPYHLLLSDIAAARADRIAEKKYRRLYEKRYPLPRPSPSDLTNENRIDNIAFYNIFS